MRLLILLVFSQYGLPCKYGKILQILIYNWTQKFNSIYSINKISFFRWFIFDVDFSIKDQRQFMFDASWI